MLKNLPVIQETWVLSLGQEDPLEKRMATHFSILGASLAAQDDKESAYNVVDLGLIPRSGRSSGEGNGNPLQYSCLENPTDTGAWGTTVCEIAKSRT